MPARASAKLRTLSAAFLLTSVAAACSAPQAADSADRANELANLKSRIAALEAQLVSVQNELETTRKREEGLREGLAPLEEKLAQLQAPPPPSEPSEPSGAPQVQPAVPPVASPSEPTSATPSCESRNTGSYGFTNTKTKTIFTVILYFMQGSDRNQTIMVQPGQTQYVYDFPAGPHNYLITYRAQVPIMSFPPGAPTMEQDVIYLRGQAYIERCKSPSMEIK